MGDATEEPSRATRLERVAGWCLWLTVWGPILTILFSFQSDVDYSYDITYRNIVFPALLVQICLRLAQASDPDLRKTLLLIGLAILQNPIYAIHFGSPWPWRIVNAVTVAASFVAVTEVRDVRVYGRAT